MIFLLAFLALNWAACTIGGVHDDCKSEFKCYKESALKGEKIAQYKLGNCYENGCGVEQNGRLAFHWYLQAAKQEYAPAESEVGSCYQYGKGVNKNEAHAFYWYSKAAGQGDASAQNSLGRCFFYGIGVEQNQTLAFEWYLKASGNGNSIALYNLGVCYQHGNGVAKNETLAFQSFSKAACQSVAMAQGALGDCYRNGIGVENNGTLAFEWYSKAAGNGIAAAQNNLGFCYQNGIGVDKNQTLAFAWYVKAAENGDASAKYFLGRCYQQGFLVEKNEKSAFHWYSEAAKQGVAEAQFYVGFCYENGFGVEKNETAAFEHYCKHISSLSIHRDLDDSAFFSASVIKGSPNDQILASAANGNLNLIVAKWTDEYRFAVNMHGENALFIAIRNNQPRIIEYLKYCARFDMDATATDLNMTPYDYYQLLPHFNDETSQLLLPSKPSSNTDMISRCHRIRSLLDGNDIDQSLTEFKSFLSDSTGVNAFFLDILLEEILAEETVNMHRLQMISLMISLYQMAHEQQKVTLDNADLIVSFVSKHQSSQFLEIIGVMEDLITAVDLEKYLSLGAESQFSRHRYSIRRLKSQKDSERLDQVARLALYFHKKNLLMDEEADLNDENVIVHDVYKQSNSAGSIQIAWIAVHLLIVGVFACFY